MKIVVATLVFVLFCIARGLGQWTHDPGPEGGMVVNFDVDAQSLYALTSTGIYKSEDEGYHWEFVAYLLGASKGLLRLVVEKGRMYGMGTDGQVLRSLDNGKIWQTILNRPPVVAGISADRLQCVTVKEDTVMVGTLFKVYTSYDRGETWTARGNFFGDGVSSVLTLNNEWFVRNGSKIFRSSNGGVSWNLVFSTVYPFAAVDIVGDRIFLLYQENNRLIKSQTGFRTWDTIHTDSIPVIYNIYGAASIIRIVGHADSLYCFFQEAYDRASCFEQYSYSTDGGAHWKRRSFDSQKIPVVFNDALGYSKHLVFAHWQGVAHLIGGEQTFVKGQTNLTAIPITALVLGNTKFALGGLSTVFIAKYAAPSWEQVNVNSNGVDCEKIDILTGTRNRWFLFDNYYPSAYSNNEGAVWQAYGSLFYDRPLASVNCIHENKLNGISHFCDGKDSIQYTNLTSYLNGATIDHLATAGEYLIVLAKDKNLLLLRETGEFVKRIPTSPCSDLASGLNFFFEFDGRNLFHFCGPNTYIYEENATAWHPIFPQDWTIGAPFNNQKITAHGTWNGLFWIAVEGRGIYYATDGTGRFYPVSPQLPYPYPTALAFKGDVIWVGTNGGGIYSLHLPPIYDPVEKAPVFSLMPNPSLVGGILHLQSNVFLTQYTTARVFDPTGRLMATSELSPSDHWDLEFLGLVPGFYSIAITTSGKNTTLKWVIMGRP